MNAAALPVPASTFTLPLAGFKQVYDCADVEEALQEIRPGQNDALADTYHRMLRVGGFVSTKYPAETCACESRPRHCEDYWHGHQSQYRGITDFLEHAVDGDHAEYPPDARGQAGNVLFVDDQIEQMRHVIRH